MRGIHLHIALLHGRFDQVKVRVKVWARARVNGEGMHLHIALLHGRFDQR